MANEDVKEDSKNQQNDIMSLIRKYARTTTLGNVIAGFAIVILVLQLSGLSIGSLTDKRFGLKTTEQEQTYQLQVKMFDLMEAKVVPKLDDILRRLGSVESKITDLEKRDDTLQLQINTMDDRISKREEGIRFIYRKLGLNID